MSRYEQRKESRLRDPDVRAGYEEVHAELALLRAIDHARSALGVSQRELASILGRTQPAVSQFLSGSYAVTLDATLEYLEALHLQARVQIVHAPEGGPALVVRSDFGDAA